MGGSKVPEPFDVRMEEAEEAGSLPVEQDQKTRQPKSPSRTSQPTLNCTYVYVECTCTCT